MDEFDYGRYQNALLPTRADGSFDLGQIADPAIVRAGLVDGVDRAVHGDTRDAGPGLECAQPHPARAHVGVRDA